MFIWYLFMILPIILRSLDSKWHTAIEFPLAVKNWRPNSGPLICSRLIYHTQLTHRGVYLLYYNELELHKTWGVYFISTNFPTCICLQVYSSGPITPVYLSLVMRKPDFCICENKDADQLRGNREADQRLCFRYIEITIPPLS